MLKGTIFQRLFYVVLVLILNSSLLNAQNGITSQQPIDSTSVNNEIKQKRIQIGGGLGLNFGSGNTNVSIAPSAIYNVNKYVSVGVGAQASYLKYRGFSESFLYGGSVIGLFNPLEYIQVSAELEQLRANVNYVGVSQNDNFWNTALFLGAGYRTGFGTLGVRYNVLHNNQNIYGDAWLPFVRVYF